MLTISINMVFNRRMSDKDLIERLGGPSAVAKLLGYESNGGPQRVHNWTKRGIPAAVKLAHPQLFMVERGAPPVPATTAEVRDAA